MRDILEEASVSENGVFLGSKRTIQWEAVRGSLWKSMYLIRNFVVNLQLL